MEDLLKHYKEKAPEIVFEWNDGETGAQGWIVINSLRNGAAGGGTRMRKGLTRDEVISLAKVMEIKFSVSGPAIGGAKSGINFDPEHPQRTEVLSRWYRAALPLLKHYYGTGGDLNVDEIKDVVPITEALGLWHPQEGIVKGHFHPGEGAQINILGQLRYGVSKIVENPAYRPESANKRFAVADLITGYGVSESVRHFYDIFKGHSPEGKTAVIQGWGNVASAAALYLVRQGVKIVGIIDRAGGIIEPNGLAPDVVNRLFDNKDGNRLASDGMMTFEEVNRRIWSLGADIFIPGAASKLITPEQARQLLDGGVEVIACGANVPFVDDDIFFGPTAREVDERTALIPDFIANCGMARVFAYLMQPEVAMTDEAIFSDTSLTIRRALEEVRNIQKVPNNISSNAVYLALKKLGV